MTRKMTISSLCKEFLDDALVAYGFRKEAPGEPVLSADASVGACAVPCAGAYVGHFAMLERIMPRFLRMDAADREALEENPEVWEMQCKMTAACLVMLSLQVCNIACNIAASAAFHSLFAGLGIIPHWLKLGAEFVSGTFLFFMQIWMLTQGLDHMAKGWREWLRIPVRRKSGTRHEEVQALVADLGDCQAWTDEGRLPVDGSLGHWEERLSEHGFFRVHRNALVNLRAVLEVTKEDEVVLGAGRLSISRRRMEELRKVLGLSNGCYHRTLASVNHQVKLAERASGY